ncbi:MAG TPA: ATP-binding protein [Actinomycetota bacterium]|jgi:signal transduction histidine kinase|nr:ATP-binding protein [Actinomycetota bacterium]
MPTKVLLCDTPDGLAPLHYALMRSGAELQLEVANDGYRAVELAARTRPEFVVTEVTLDGLSGGELVRRLLAAVPDTSVICWTDAPSPLLAADLLEAGAAAYVSKADGPEGVSRAIRAAQAGTVSLSPRIASRIVERLAVESHRRAALETTVAETTARLEALTTAKADFLANVSHELRTPVTIAKGISYVLRNRGIPEDEQREFLGQLEASLDKLALLVDEMLTVAELDRGSFTLRVDEVDLAPVLIHAADEISRQYPTIAIVRELPDTLVGAADPVRFAEIVRQILDNACRYTREHRPVALRARLMEEGVVVSVTDCGDGMLRETVARAFDEPFVAGEDILRKERAGAGVGLHLARQLVLQHGGIMWADPVPAGGTLVAFVIPAHRGDHVRKPELGDPTSPSDLGEVPCAPSGAPPTPYRRPNAISS